ncbi:MAG: membrane protein insertase YidC [Candidatus Rokubacteria bacterium]|nr:membrane protein insertase YidC [Candidatus Rokubacteria bacterium]
MEKRAILAAVLMAGLLILYQTLFAPAPPPPAPVQAPVEPKPAPLPPPTPLPQKVQRPADIPRRMVFVESPLFHATVGSDGGKLHDWVLHYRGDKPMVVPGALGPRGVMVQRPGGAAEGVAFTVKEERLTLGPHRPRGELALTGQDAFGLRVTEALRFEAQDFRVEIALRLENRQAVPQLVELLLPWSTPKKWPEDQKEGFQGQRPTRVIRHSGGEIHRDDLEKVGDVTDEGRWVGLESDWYLAAWIPLTPGFKLVASKGGNGTVEISLKATPPPLASGQVWEGRALLYVGPKEYDRLKALGVGLEGAIDFGGFPLPRRYGGLPMEWLGVPILWLMNFFTRYIGNYGLAIILLTVITKILFYPLTLKSLASMKAMQALQPQINALRAKYAKDPQRLQRETMELYRKHKVNPMGGCLPMVIQIPIFYALYLVFQYAVELQNAAFLCIGKAPGWLPLLGGEELWICNLAHYDPTYVLPVLMGVSMFVQQKMSPTVGDPRQAKVMLVLPLVFTFMFLNLPSGLVLYWFVSNVLQILQQHYMDRRGRSVKISGKEAKEGQRA